MGVALYQHSQNAQEHPLADTSGFDIARVESSPSLAATPMPAPRQESGLGMVKSGLPGIQFGQKAEPSPRVQAESSFTQLCRASETKVRALAEAYTRRYPIIAAYGREWMSYPDLKKLNDDYMRNHDPVAFMRGVSVSKNFAAMIKKYAVQPPIQQFVKDGIKQAPPGMTAAAMGFLNQDGKVKGFVDNVAQNLGLPPNLFSGGSSNEPPKIDQNAIMGSIMKGNPEMQKALSNPDVQKSLNSPDVQKSLANPQ